MQTQQTQNSFPAPKCYLYFREKGPLGRVVKSWVKITPVAKFKFRYESVKTRFSYIIFFYNLMIG